MKHQNSAMPAQRGFTLSELVVVVAIVGILLAVALPGYQNSMQKGRRSDAKSALLDVANRQEQFMLDHNTYTTDMTDLGFSADPMVSEEQYYTVDAAACTSGAIGNCYLLTATPQASGPLARDSRCTTLTLDSRGQKNASGSAVAECW
ncbi:MAG: type IV pilin protein [Parahaliea sp.]